MSYEGEQPLHTSPTPTVPPTPQLTSKSSLLIPDSPAPSRTLSFHAQKHETCELDDDDETYFGSLPPGYKFVPTDDELIVHYLRRKIHNFPLPRNKITDVKLYEHNPQLLAGKYEYCKDANNDKRWYFFTPRERKYKNGFRPNRAAGDGYWKATGADKQIKYKGQLVGFRKSLVFYLGKPPRGQKTNWIMHEYRVSDPCKPRIGSHDMKLDDWVLCRVHEKEERHAARNQQEDEGNSVSNVAVDDGEIDDNERNGRLMLSLQVFADQHLPFPDNPYPDHPYPDHFYDPCYDPCLLNCPIPSPIYFGNNVENLNNESLNFGGYGNMMPLRPFWKFNHDELLYGGVDSSFMNVPMSVPISAVAAFPSSERSDNVQSDNVQSDNFESDNVQYTTDNVENSDNNAPTP